MLKDAYSLSPEQMSALAALGSYGGSSSSDDDDEPAAPPPTALLERRVVTAPRVVGASTLALNPARRCSRAPTVEWSKK